MKFDLTMNASQNSDIYMLGRYKLVCDGKEVVFGIMLFHGFIGVFVKTK